MKTTKKTIITYICEGCDTPFNDKAECQRHEKKCKKQTLCETKGHLKKLEYFAYADELCEHCDRCDETLATIQFNLFAHHPNYKKTQNLIKDIFILARKKYKTLVD